MKKQLKGFKKERLILMEALRSLSFIGTLPFSASTPPHKLLIDLTTKGAHTDISHYKYMLFDNIFNCMLRIYAFDNALVTNTEVVKFEISRCLDLFSVFEETKIILEEFEYKDLSEYSLIEDDLDVLELEESILLEAQAFNTTGETIFPNNITIVEIAAQRSHPRTHYPNKIVMLYCLVYLMQMATEVGVKGAEMKALDEKYLYIGYLMKHLGLAHSMEVKIERIEEIGYSSTLAL